MRKMLVEIIGENVTTKRRVPDLGGKILLKKGTKGRGRGDVYAKYSTEAVERFYRGIWPIKWLDQKVRMIVGADKCIEIHRKPKPDGKTEVEVITPQYDSETARRLFDANAVKNAGAVSTQLKVPFILYALLMMGFFLHFIVLMVVSGRLKL